jgi:hypothetical protein
MKYHPLLMYQYTDNKSRTVLRFCQWLVEEGYFEKIKVCEPQTLYVRNTCFMVTVSGCAMLQVSFLLVGHTRKYQLK